jgi:hypothetical protein
MEFSAIFKPITSISAGNRLFLAPFLSMPGGLRAYLPDLTSTITPSARTLSPANSWHTKQF